ncbi:hypothetical protein GCM10023340_04000 [Nocardioides marinquilinus]|uniref:YcaO domain-containing protein n=1 Tax=Nocardioides marinquilinus TaxID=1210400 RepID=A0ABP9P6U5_9ACTN
MATTPESIVDAFRGALRPFGTVLEFGLESLDRTGLPVSNASLLVDGRLTHHGNGYGTTSATALVGGLGELVERVVGADGVRRLRASAEHGSRRELVARHGSSAVVDPRLLALPAGADWSEDRPGEWLPLADVRTDERVWVPVELVASDATEAAGVADPLLPSVTNGLGAGLDRERALAHGLGEVLQRHTNGLRFRSLDRLSPAIEDDGLPPSVAALVAQLRAVGIDPVLKVASTGLGVCSTYVMGRDDAPPAPIALSGCGEGAHADPAASLTKALLEFAHSRARKVFCFGEPSAVLGVAPAAYRDAIDPRVGDERSASELRRWSGLGAAELGALVLPEVSRSVPFASLAPSGAAPTSDAPSDVLAHHLHHLADHRVLAATYERDGVVATKVLVTGLDVETLAMGRLGEHGVRESLHHDLDLVRIAPEPVGEHRSRVHLTPDAEDRLGGAAWFSYAAAERIVGRQYPQYREPGRHSVVV